MINPVIRVMLMNSLLSTIFLLIILLETTSIHISNPHQKQTRIHRRVRCHARFFHADSFVCVCSLRRCDNLGQILYPPRGMVHIYLSDIHRYRLSLRSREGEKLKPGKEIPDVNVTLHPDIKEQRFLGFGGAFTDSSGINVLSLPAKLGDNIIKEYFCQKGGINYAIGRVPIGLTDFSVRTYTYDDVEDDLKLEFFSLMPEDFMFKLALIRKAQVCQPALKLLAAAWFPPAWALTGHVLDSGRYLKGPVGGKFYQMYANYHVKFLDAYKEEGIEFWALSTANEPYTARVHNISTPFQPWMLRDFINTNLGPTLERHGYGNGSLKLLAFDDILPVLSQYCDPIFNDLRAASYVSGVSYHWYKNHLTGHSILKKFHQKHPRMLLINSEACYTERDEDPVSLGNWTRAEKYAVDIIKSTNNFVSSWIDWNLALNMQGGPNRIKNFVEAPIHVNARRKEYYRQPSFYALAHFSKFIEPGSRRIGFRFTKRDREVMMTAFLDIRGHIIIVIINLSIYEKKVNIEGLYAHPIQIDLPAKSFQTVLSQQRQE